MVIDRVGEGRHERARKTPAKTASDHIAEGPDIVFSQFRFVCRVTDPWDDVVILVLVEGPVDLVPLLLKLYPVCRDALLEYSVLELFDLGIRPQERQVCEVDNVKEGFPKAGLTLRLLVPYVDNQGQKIRI